MSGINQLDEMLRALLPTLQQGEYVFCTVTGELTQYLHLNPIASFIEAEGLTLVLHKEIASDANLHYDGVFKQITLSVHSSLNAVGLTAAVSSKLASKQISANVIAAYYHDHIFVPIDNAELALATLTELMD
ncbi:ACT domain-containing protein [Thaumasiovibrio sp. DFM-14]|uniref:ACT domain-containing protein n=1 Tax=Thaumasiovibrio sp. DFM-14 TaxID=3384792 RepID=UPI0039A0F679